MFLRNKKRLIPTPFGELMYNQAVHLIEEFQKALETLEKAKREAASLKIGLAANVFSALKIESLIAQFQEQNPAISIKISNETDYICETKIENGELDAAFSMGPFTSPDIVSYYLTCESIYALLPKAYPIGNKNTLNISDLYSEALITSDIQNKGYAVLLKDFQKKGLTPHIVFRSDEPLSHLELVRKNIGISLFPEHWLPMLNSIDDVRALPVCDLHKRELFMILKKGVSENHIRDKFVHFICRAFETFC